MMVDHLGDDEPQELLGEHRIEPGLDRQSTEPGDLGRLALEIGRRAARPAALCSPTAWVILNRSASR